MKRIITAAMLAAVASGFLGEGSSAQERRPLVNITSGFRPEPLPPPPAPATGMRAGMAAAAAYDVQRWMDRSDAPDTLASSRGATIVLAADLRLQNVQYKIDAPVLALVADKLRIGPNAMIDASEWRTGGARGKVIILANEIVCEPGGALRIVANGAGVSSGGGQVLVAGASQPAASAGALPPCIAATVDGAPGRTGEVHDHRRSGAAIVRDHRDRRQPQSQPPGTMTRILRRGDAVTILQPQSQPPSVSTQTFPAGAAGRIFASTDIREVTQGEELARAAWSMWAVERLEMLRFNIYEASRRGDRQGVVSLFREYEAFNPSSQMIGADMRDRYLAVVADLQTYRRNAMPPLWVEELSVRPGGLPQPVTAFTEGATFRTSLAPTHALASRASIGGRSVLGLIDYRSERPDELAIEAEWELSVDPWVEQLAAEQLKKTGRRLEGVFGGWSLEAKPMQEMGVRSATATLLPGGRRLRMRLTADAERANLVFWRLLNSAGLPWSVDWKFTEPGSGRVVTGTWAGPALTLARQRDPQVALEEGHLVNKGPHAVVVNYLRMNDGSFVALNPAMRLAAGERVPVPGDAARVGPSAIPPEAVESAFNLDTFGSDFYVLNGEQVVDRVVVRNLLPTSDDARGAFDRLEITVKADVEGDGAAGIATAGPFVLSAAGTGAAEISIPFLRLARGQRHVAIEGRAYYAGGSYRTLKPTKYDALSIAITPDMFQ